MKKSIIKKFITRKISTAPYETLDVHVEVQEEVEWESPEEREKKTNAISKVLLIDFVKTLDQVTEELNVNKKIASITNKKNVSKTQEDKANSSINRDTDGEDFDFFG